MKREPIPALWFAIVAVLLSLAAVLVIGTRPPAPVAIEEPPAAVEPVTKMRVCRGCEGKGRAWPTLDGRWLPYDYSGPGILVEQGECGQCGGDGLEEVPVE